MDIKTNFTLYLHSRDLHQSLIKKKGVCVIGIHCLNIYVSILINKNVHMQFQLHFAMLIYNNKKKKRKKEISKLVYTTRFWNNLHHVSSMPKYLKDK